jgi:hypothetical protein
MWKLDGLIQWTNLAGSCKAGYGSKRVVLGMMMISNSLYLSVQGNLEHFQLFALLSREAFCPTHSVMFLVCHR